RLDGEREDRGAGGAVDVVVPEDHDALAPADGRGDTLHRRLEATHGARVGEVAEARSEEGRGGLRILHPAVEQDLAEGGAEAQLASERRGPRRIHGPQTHRFAHRELRPWPSSGPACPRPSGTSAGRSTR